MSFLAVYTSFFRSSPMKKSIPLLYLLLLGACTAAPGQTSIDQQNNNPLVASRYGDELADRMANLIIIKDPIVDQPGMRQVIDDAIAEGKKMGAQARQMQQQGLMGQFFSVHQAVGGFALLLNDVLYFSSDFATDPGLDLHVYVTSDIDPREIPDFPNINTTDIGAVQNPYGAQVYEIDAENSSDIRTVVLWDKTLKRLYGFAQLAR